MSSVTVVHKISTRPSSNARVILYLTYAEFSGLCQRRVYYHLTRSLRCHARAHLPNLQTKPERKTITFSKSPCVRRTWPPRAWRRKHVSRNVVYTVLCTARRRRLLRYTVKRRRTRIPKQVDIFFFPCRAAQVFGRIVRVDYTMRV